MTILFIRLLSCPLFDSFVTNHLVKKTFFNWNLFANALRGKVEKHSWQIKVSLSLLVDNYHFMNILSTKLLSFHKYMSKKYFWDLYLYDTELHKQIEKYFRDLCNHFRTIWANILLKIENTFEISSIISWLFEQKYIPWLTKRAQMFYTFEWFTFRGRFFFVKFHCSRMCEKAQLFYTFKFFTFRGRFFLWNFTVAIGVSTIIIIFIIIKIREDK